MNDSPEINESVTASVLEIPPWLSSEDGVGAKELIQNVDRFQTAEKSEDVPGELSRTKRLSRG
jgi:hypothetical protein